VFFFRQVKTISAIVKLPLKKEINTFYVNFIIYFPFLSEVVESACSRGKHIKMGCALEMKALHYTHHGPNVYKDTKPLSDFLKN
jgi:hypothetical protein